jgi:hypothetical protein
LIQDGQIDPTEDGLVLVEETDESPKERTSAGKGFCPINRVKNPNEVGVGVFFSKLFTDDAMIWVSLVNEVPEGLFRLLVSDGYRGLISLQIHGEGCV